MQCRFVIRFCACCLRFCCCCCIRTNLTTKQIVSYDSRTHRHVVFVCTRYNVASNAHQHNGRAVNWKPFDERVHRASTMHRLSACDTFRENRFHRHSGGGQQNFFIFDSLCSLCVTCANVGMSEGRGLTMTMKCTHLRTWSRRKQWVRLLSDKIWCGRIAFTFLHATISREKEILSSACDTIWFYCDYMRVLRDNSFLTRPPQLLISSILSITNIENIWALRLVSDSPSFPDSSTSSDKQIHDKCDIKWPRAPNAHTLAYPLCTTSTHTYIPYELYW